MSITNQQKEKFQSRKFTLTIISLCILIAMTIASQYMSIVQGLYPTFVGGLLGILSSYFCGNIAHKYVINKTMTQNNNQLDESLNGED